MRITRLLAALLLAVFLAVSVIGAQNALPTILQRAQKNSDRVRDYKADASLTLKSAQTHVRDMKFKVYFKRPDMIKVEAKEGFALLPKDTMAIGDPINSLRASHKISSLGRTKLGGVDCELLKATPKTESDGSGTMKIWVERRRALILRTESTSSHASVDARLSHILVDGKYWMPSRVTASIKSGNSASGSDINSPHGRIRQPHSMDGKLTLTFSKYSINKGIPDSVFRQSQAKP